MTARSNDNRLMGKDFSDLAGDRERWDSYLAALQKSPFLSFLRPQTNGPAWDDMGPEEKASVWTAFTQIHGKIFNYAPEAPALIPADNKKSDPGFWGNIFRTQRGPAQAYDMEFDGGFDIPDIDPVAAFQIMVHGQARNFLLRNLYDALQSEERDFPHKKFVGDFEQFNVSASTMFDMEIEDMKRMYEYPMPDRFEEWMEMPSRRYAMQAATYMSGEIFGRSEIHPALLPRLRQDYMGMQHDILTCEIGEDGKLGDMLSDEYRAKWETRARTYVEETFRHPDDLDIERGVSMARLMKINGFKCELPDAAKKKTQGNRFLRIMAASSMDDSVELVRGMNLATIRDLTTIERARLIETLGPQDELDLVNHETCNLTATVLLRTDPLDQGFMAHYTALFAAMAKEFQDHDELNTMAGQWKAGSNASENLAFLVRLNEEISKHMGIEPRPVFTFDHEGKMEGRYRRQAMGFASYGHSRKHLKDEYNLTLPEGFDGPLIGLNTSRSICMMNDLTPRRAAGVLVHEIGHHVDEDLQDQFRKGAIGKDHVLAPHAIKTAEWRQHGRTADNRLRSDFSLKVYPEIPTEKVPYWFTQAFEAAKPFKFHY